MRKSEKVAATTAADVLRTLHTLCPPALAYEWDSVGLHLGSPDAPVRRVLLALEADDRTIALAQAQKCDMIISHHPLLFRPLKSLRSDDPTARKLLRLSALNIALATAHTNFDCAACSMNRTIADALELTDTRSLEPRVVPVAEPNALEATYKLVVFAPTDYADAIIDAIHRGGGATQGNYSHATFRTAGTGTFKPCKGAKPFVGKVGALESVNEQRIESLVAGHRLAAVLDAVRQAHPYEEAAWDVYRLAAAPGQTALLEVPTNTGLGVMGKLPKATTLAELAARVATLTGATNPPMCSGEPTRKIRTVCVMGGAGSSMLGRLLARRPDAFITGEFGYHETLAAAERGISIIALGHATSERLFAPALRDALIAADPHRFGTTVELIADTACTDALNAVRS